MPYWVGDPLRGAGKNQPGGWIFSLLPYVEQESVYRLPDDGDADRITAQQMAKASEMLKVALPIFQCPSRRPAMPYPYTLGSEWNTVNAAPTDLVARSDFAGNGGDFFDESFPFFEKVTSHDQHRYSSLDNAIIWASTSKMNGVIFMRSEIGASKTTDGTSKTYLLGEKHLNSNFYDNGLDPGDNHSMYQGFDRDIIRWTAANLPPSVDTEADDSSLNFGSTHVSGFNMVMCDGSVRQIGYDIGAEIHQAYGNRHDSK